MRWLAESAATRPRRHLAVLLAISLLSAACLVLVGNALLGDRSDFDDPASESVAARALLTELSGESPEPELQFLLAPRRDPGSVAGRAEIAAAVREIEGHAGVARVAVAVEPASRAAPARSRTALLGVYARPLSAAATERLGVALEARVRRSHDVLVGGPVAINRDINAVTSKDVERIETIVVPIVFLMLIFVFRGVTAAFLPVAMGLVTTLVAAAALQLVARVAPVSIFALNLVTAIGLGLAIDYSLLIVARYRAEIARHGAGAKALRETLGTAGRSVAFSAAVLVLAMSTLLLFPQRFLYSMGIGGIACTAIAGLLALAGLPAVLALLGERVNSLALSRWRRLNRGDGESPFWSRVARAIVSRPRLALAIGVAAIALLALPALQLRLIGVDETVLPAGTEARQVATAISRDYPNVPRSYAFVLVRAPERARDSLVAYRTRLASTGARISSPRYLGRGAWALTVGGGARPLAPASVDLVERARALAPPFPTHVGGLAAGFVDERQSILAHLPPVLLLLGLATVAVLTLMTRSLVLALKAMLMNLLSLLAAIGVLVAIFQEGAIGGFSPWAAEAGLDLTQPVLFAVIAFALATDYGVFLLSRICELHRRGEPDAEAIRGGMASTGRVITAAAALFCVAVGCLAFSRVSLLRELGIGLAAAVIVDATIVRAILVPASMTLLGRWNWWAPSSLARRWRVEAEVGGPP